MPPTPPAIRLALVLAGCIASTAPDSAAAEVACGGPALVAGVVGGIFGGDASAADVNADERVGAADLAAAAALGDPPRCPLRPAALVLDVDNRSGSPTVAVTLRGRRLRCDCRDDDLAGEFERSFLCLGPDPRRCGRVDGLAPGEWLLEFRVDAPATGQVQYRRELLVGAEAAVVSAWTAHASVLVVDRADNTGIGSLRNRLQLARDARKPVLVRFADDVFPAGEPTLVPITFALTTLDADDVTVDGIDALGLAGNRGVDAGGQAFGAFSVSGARNRIVGLRLRGAGGEDRDLLRVAGGRADGNVFERLVVEGPASGDGIGVDDGAGDDLGATATVIRDCVIRGARDKGVKVTTGAHARVEASWIEGNANGGVQATLGGHVSVVGSVVENNAGIGGENGLAVQGLDEFDALSTLTVEDSIVRGNGGNGLSVRAFATAVVGDTAFAGNGTAGMRVFNDVGAPALAVAEGSAFACNALDGAVVANGSLADLGGGPFASDGANAFSGNGAGGPGFDLRNVSANPVSAAFGQWDGCGAGAVCNEAAVLAGDVRDGGAGVAISPAVAAAGLGPPLVTRVEPQRGRAGELVWIHGAGFDAVAGHGGTACLDPGVANSCAPLRANCVRIGGAAAEVVAVTPTLLVVRRPQTCLEPVGLEVAVRRIDAGAVSEPVRVCDPALP